jgi:hypothetical protein
LLIIEAKIKILLDDDDGVIEVTNDVPEELSTSTKVV